MKSIAVPPRALAFLFTLIMMGPIVPLAEASHTASLVPDLPLLPQARESDQCVQVALPQAVAAEINRVARGEQPQVKLDGNVPALCGSRGERIEQWRTFIQLANVIFTNYTTTVLEVQRQADQRVEHTLPEGSLTRPQYTLLSDRFDGSRVAGFGNWTAYAKEGKPPTFAPAPLNDLNGTRNPWRFGDDKGYARGAHEWLVSPELDLTATSGNRTASGSVLAARHVAIRALWGLCNGISVPQTPLAQSPLSGVCGDQATSLTQMLLGRGSGLPDADGRLLVQAYEAAMESVLRDVPLANEAAYVDITYRTNFPLGQDGVRVWAATGDAAPGPAFLFDPNFGRPIGAFNATGTNCVGPSAARDTDLIRTGTSPDPGQNPASLAQYVNLVENRTIDANFGPYDGDIDCERTLNSAVVLPLNGTIPVSSFSGRGGENLALTGDSMERRTIRYNLTPFQGQRIWLLFEIRTQPDLLGTAFFDDRGVFPEPKNYGFELSRIHAVADGYHRNLRLKDFASPDARMPAGNPYGDPAFVRVAAPPGHEGLTLRVHNAGSHIENATLALTVTKWDGVEFVANRTLAREVQNVRPDEIRTIRVDWGEHGIGEGDLFHVDARLNVREVAGVRTNLTLGPSMNNTDPSSAAVRPANAADSGLGGRTNATLFVRAFAKREITPIPPLVRDNVTNLLIVGGRTLTTCKSIVDGVCEETSHAAAKGEARSLLMRVRNDGTRAEDVVATLKLELLGVDRTGNILDGAARTLATLAPGESRVVAWALNPTEPGAWRARVFLTFPNGTTAGPVSEARMFVHRSTGIVCYDDLSADRQCGPSLAGGIAADLEDRNVTALATDAAGGFVAATSRAELHKEVDSSGVVLKAWVTEDREIRQRAATTDRWTFVANVSREKLIADGLPGRAEAGAWDYQTIRALAYGPNGTLYAVGDDGTALAIDVNGTVSTLERYAPMEILPGTRVQGHPGSPVHVLGGAYGGKPPYTYQWQVVARPPASVSAPLSSEGPTVQLRPDVTGGYLLQVNVTDARGVWKIGEIEVDVVAAPSASVSTPHLTTVVAAAEGREAIRVSWTPNPQAPPATGFVVERFQSGLQGTGIVATLPAGATTYLDQGLPAGIDLTYRVRALHASGQGPPSNATVAIADHRDLPDYKAVATFRDRVWIAGERGEILRVNGTALEVFNITSASPTDGSIYIDPETFTLRIYQSTFRDLQVVGDRLFLAGDEGVVYVHDGNGWNQTSTQDGVNFRDILDLFVHDGALYAVGRGNLVMVNEAPTKFDVLASRYRGDPRQNIPSFNLTSAVFPARSTTIVRGVSSHEGGLYLIDESTRFAACVACGKKATWTYPEVPLPIVVSNIHESLTGRARLAQAATTGAKTIVAGLGGVVLDVVDKSAANNDGDWSTMPTFLAHDGTALETIDPALTGTYGFASIFRIASEGAGVGYLESATGANEAVRQAVALRLTMNHHVKYVHSAAPLMVRIYHGATPSYHLGNQFVCEQETGTTSVRDPDDNWYKGIDPCSGLRLFQHSFSVNTTVEGWETFRAEGIPVRPGMTSVFVELVKPDVAGLDKACCALTYQPLWAIDDVVLEGLVNGAWVPLAAYYGLGDPRNTPYGPADDKLDVAGRQDGLMPADGFLHTHQPFRQSVQSPWHLAASFADRPVWAANDAFLGGDPTAPRLRNNWSSRLITPTVNLSDVEDAVVSFRHMYSFRTEVVTEGSEGAYRLAIGDIGAFEISYEKRGSECGEGLPPETRCWSRFTRLSPYGNYPGISEVGYPKGTTQVTAVPWNAGPGAATGYPWNFPNVRDQGDGSYYDVRSWWGTLARPTPSGGIEDTRFTDRFVEERFPLRSAICGQPGAFTERCIPSKELQTLDGRNVRFAFLIQTCPIKLDNINSCDSFPVPGVSYPGEGWYVTDLKVLGSAKPGVDLVVSKLDFDVGYDVDEIGVGPGTRVPIRVQVANPGMFDILGYRGSLEVHRVLDPVKKKTLLVETIPLAQQPVLEAGKQANHTVVWSVPNVEGATYSLKFVASTVAEEAFDEDPTNNVKLLGTLANPIPASKYADYDVDLIVAPADATTDITRYLPVFLNNTGNVPLEGFKLRREIQRDGVTIETAAWTTSTPLPAGVRMPLSALSEDLNPATDLFWKAPESANYLVRLRVENEVKRADGEKVTLVRSDDQRVRAYATYLFDDVEGGPRGEAIRGDWVRGEWTDVTPGFRSSAALGFGDPTTGRMPANGDASLVAPTLDLTSARSARLAFFHRYSFEPGFDAGRLEASTDGGKTWMALNPRPDPLNGLPKGYNDTFPLTAASKLHLTGNPDDRTYAYTGDSAKLPTAADGWVLTQFDLTDLDAVTQQNVTYRRFDSIALAAMNGTTADKLMGNRSYRNDAWVVGQVENAETWETEVLSQGDVRSIVGDATFWWSGSPLSVKHLHAYDQSATSVPWWGPRFNNTALRIGNATGGPINLTGLAADQKVVVDWWEWSDLTGRYIVNTVTGGAQPTFPAKQDQLTSTAAPTIGGQVSGTFRLNLSEVKVVEQKGKWVHMVADITAFKAENPFYIEFVYAPVWDNVDSMTYAGRYGEFAGDRGFAIDGFTIRTFREANGKPFDVQTLMTEEDAWKSADRWECAQSAKGYRDSSQGSDRTPCFQTATPIPQTAKIADDACLPEPHNSTVDPARHCAVNTCRWWGQGAFTVNIRRTVAKTDLTIELDDVRGFVSFPAFARLGGKELVNITGIVSRDAVGNGGVVSLTRDDPSQHLFSGPGSNSMTRSVSTLDRRAACSVLGNPSAYRGTGPYGGANAEVRLRTYNLTEKPGLTWSRVTTIPAVDAKWHVVRVVDERLQSTLRTGERSLAWWTGDPTTCANNMTNTAPTVAPTDARFRTCPGADSRLVTPVIDLATVAGTSVDVTFRHRYAFHQWLHPELSHPVGSGGAVEIQEFDTQTGTWGPWKQVFGKPLQALPEKPSCADLRKAEHFPGYPNRTASAVTWRAKVVHNPAPFEKVSHDFCDAEPSGLNEMMYVFSGRSGNTRDGAWTDARFDLSPWIGKTVRLGFHAYFSGVGPERQKGVTIGTDRTAQEIAAGTNPSPPDFGHIDSGEVGIWPNHAKGGWWIKDIQIVGEVLRAGEVQLRLRAATDGNVDAGFWQVDDVGLFGERYQRNVGLFVDGAAGRFGSVVNKTVEIPVTVRNFGTTVRRDLAVEVRQFPASGGPLLRFDGGGVPAAVEKFHLTGITLAPGQSRTVLLNVTTPLEIPPIPGDPTGYNTTLLFRLLEYNPTQRDLVAVSGNEIEGFLQGNVTFRAERVGNLSFVGARADPARPALGEPVNLTLTLKNEGYVGLGLNMTCKAGTVASHSKVDHASEPATTVTYAKTYDCGNATGPATIPAKSFANITYRVTPTAAGFLRLDVTGNLIDGIDNGKLPRIGASVVVAGDPRVLTTGISDAEDVRLNWTEPTIPYGQPDSLLWHNLRGNRAPGALLIGIPDQAADLGMSYFDPRTVPCAPTCVAVSPPADLHNLTTDDAFLTFWRLDRFALGDGGDVAVQILVDETRPNQVSSWGPPGGCRLEPVGGYEGHTRSYISSTTDQQGNVNVIYDDSNPSAPVGPNHNSIRYSPVKYYVSGNGSGSGGWEEAWQRSVFPLSGVTCDPLRGTGPMSLQGHTVRFMFRTFVGPNIDNSAIRRGPGQGWLIDDVSVGPNALVVGPPKQGAALVDDTTKTFHVVVENIGDQPDLVRLRVDEGNSSIPAGSVLPPPGAIAFEPNTRMTLPFQVKLPRDPSLLPTTYRVRVFAESLYDPNVGGDTILEIAFGPREWPELALRAEIPRHGVQEGTEVTIPITIENSGLVTSVPSKVRIIDEWDSPTGRQRVVFEEELPPIPPFNVDPDGAIVTLAFTYKPLLGSVGTHTLTFEADPLVLGEEYSRANNVAVLKVEVVELLIPDVDVSSPTTLRLRGGAGQILVPQKEGDVLRYEATAGELLSLEATVKNQGRAGATNVVLGAYVGPSLSLPARTIPFIAGRTVAPGEATVVFNWIAQKGEYPITLVASSEQVEDLANNRFPGKGLVILTVKGFDVTVEADAPAGRLEPGREVTVPYRIANAGNAGEELRLVARGTAGVQVELRTKEIYMPAGAVHEGVARVRVREDAVAGEHGVTIDAIAKDAVTKSAGVRVPVLVQASYAGSIPMVDVAATPAALQVPVRLVNEGNSLEPWTFTARLPPGWTAKQVLPAKVVVPARGETIFMLDLVAPEGTPPGLRLLPVKATLADGTVREGTVRLDVLPLRGATLHIETAEPREARGSLAYALTVENRGNVEAPFSVLLLDTPPGLGVRVEPAIFTLPPGGRAAATLYVKPTPALLSGTYPVTGYAHFAGVMPESSEARANLQTMTVSLTRPDLQVAPIEYAPRADIRPGERIVVQVPVTNRGTATVLDTPVHLFADDVFVAEARIPQLTPGERRDVTFNWTALPGGHTLTVVVDPYADTVDGDRADNAASVLVQAGGDLPPGARAASREDVPAPGASLVVLVGLAAAILLASTRRKGPWRPRK